LTEKGGPLAVSVEEGVRGDFTVRNTSVSKVEIRRSGEGFVGEILVWGEDGHVAAY
jgi:hypothetical protein